MRLKPYLFVFIVTASMQIVACGQTGDLYLPENEKPKRETQEQTELEKEKSKN